MIKRIGGAVIKFSLRHLEFWWDGLVHYSRGERRLRVKLGIERARRSNFEGLQLKAHVIDLSSEIDPPKIGRWEGPMIIGGLGNESRTGGVTRFRGCGCLTRAAGMVKAAMLRSGEEPSLTDDILAEGSRAVEPG